MGGPGGSRLALAGAGTGATIPCGAGIGLITPAEGAPTEGAVTVDDVRNKALPASYPQAKQRPPSHARPQLGQR